MRSKTTIRVADLNASTMAHVASVLADDGVVCFPTDTVYGLAVNPRSPRAVRRLFEVKGRPFHKPVLLLVGSISMARSVTLPDPTLERLAEEFWPGPITLVTHAREDVFDSLTGGTGTVGLRWPGASVPMQLIARFGGPITGTSANRSGQPVARTSDEVFEQLGDGVDLVIDGGRLDASLASTVLDLTQDPPVLLREGAVPYDALTSVLSCGIQRRGV